jgi:CheY-like chemotaxis protein
MNAASDESREAVSDEPARSVVLIVEDEVLIRLAVADALRGMGALVAEASNAAEALALVACGLRPDVLLTDVRMPGEIDGLQLARRLMAEEPSMLVYVTSGHLAASSNHPADVTFLPKPYDPELAALKICNDLKTKQRT